uniref:ADP-ribosylation factor-like protein 6-interacting protein 4 n=1 Tax=Odontella aurita TaxID=265563 RepID=A0A7S4J1R6_9STRA|mmetsp:Transcript_35720/g.106605  ORF Transcript_35720/g.106605 Transcript_35720/m.106605 type:complete len:350 (+) Transcript_35720:72-1121(+)
MATATPQHRRNGAGRSRSGYLSHSPTGSTGPNAEQQRTRVDGDQLEKSQNVHETNPRLRDRDGGGRRSRLDSSDESPSRSSVSKDDRRKRRRKIRSDRCGRGRERSRDRRNDRRGRSSSSCSASSTSRSSEDDYSSDSEGTHRRKRRRKRKREEKRNRERRGDKKKRKKSRDRRREKRTKRKSRSRKKGKRRDGDSNNSDSVGANDEKNDHVKDRCTEAVPRVEARDKDGEKCKCSSISDVEGGQKPPPADPSTTEKATTENEKAAASRSMVPMSREEYEAQRSVIREVYDPDTGRMRLVRGDGEIIERIVSREDHARINRLATAGDGRSFARGVSAAASSLFSSIHRP